MGVRTALLDARQRTLLHARAYVAALGPAMAVAYDTRVNPPIWELGHIGWFQEYWVGRNSGRNKGVRWDESYRPTQSSMPAADALYDSSRIEHRTRWALDLPNYASTLHYLEATLAQTLGLLDALDEKAGDDELYFFRLVALHEEMHAEASAYMARALGIAFPSYAKGPLTPASATTLRIPAQLFCLGHTGAGFAFDNELGAHELALDAFEIDTLPVSWMRFSDFVRGGGYEQQQWWSEGGWQWLQRTGPSCHNIESMEPDAPAVHLSAHEAHAWCRWAGRRLPTEAEWECAAITQPGFAWGRVWEWTASPFERYPGFQPHPYRDYSAPWFTSRLVLRGACDATSRYLADPRYRNFFEPHRNDVFAGFRSCV